MLRTQSQPAFGRTARRRLVGVLVLLVLPVFLLGTIHYIRARMAAPDLRQQVVAKLASWGLSLDGVKAPVSEAAVEQRLADLRSPVGEVRVQAARWLAARGLRETGPSIAAAMDDPGTRRPCQLAKSLGELGDSRWTGRLVQATQHPSNVDLRVCATIALEQLESPQAVEGLIAGYRRDVSPKTALQALGKIGHPAALPMLRDVVQHPRDAIEARLAKQAIERIELMQRDDPIPGLIERIKTATAGFVNPWAVRQLAERGDERAVSALRDALEHLGRAGSTSDRVTLAAALLAHGEPGRTALRSLARAESKAARISRVTLSITDSTSPAQATRSTVDRPAPVSYAPSRRGEPLPITAQPLEPRSE